MAQVPVGCQYDMHASRRNSSELCFPGQLINCFTSFATGPAAKIFCARSNPEMMFIVSSSVDKKFGSIAGGVAGSDDWIMTVPVLVGRVKQMLMPMIACKALFTGPLAIKTLTKGATKKRTRKRTTRYKTPGLHTAEASAPGKSPCN
eukprot:CAMPEP_0179172616 /NCGR_PEP_ID=MMETSP0796-20121207/85140_1 /TAXON_ID=73915 /ORGANISM="Pyrodinium bahamense, Strain pbaha01" /LENGTH=146 /DNA_ID=CAMNT_0020875769 /DNA_START=102 /DNA_END=539 /DNA_ORIENTATION=-